MSKIIKLNVTGRESTVWLENVKLKSAIERVRELHQRDEDDEACILCTELIQGEGLFVYYPCPTIDALNGDINE